MSSPHAGVYLAAANVFAAAAEAFEHERVPSGRMLAAIRTFTALVAEACEAQGWTYEQFKALGGSAVTMACDAVDVLGGGALRWIEGRWSA